MSWWSNRTTYGNRLHQPIGPVKQKLARLVKRVSARGGHISSFFMF
jgi:metallo-beta-lactamase family protein